MGKIAMDHIDYIKNWYITHNKYLGQRSDKDLVMKVLIFLTIVFEKVADIKHDDQIIKKGDSYDFISGPHLASEDMKQLLRIINTHFAYLEYEDLIRTPEYRLFFDYGREEDGILDDKALDFYFGKAVTSLQQEYANFDFQKEVYKVNNKVFFCDSVLTEDEIDRLKQISIDNPRLLWEVFHEHGKMFYF